MARKQVLNWDLFVLQGNLAILSHGYFNQLAGMELAESREMEVFTLGRTLYYTLD